MKVVTTIYREKHKMTKWSSKGLTEQVDNPFIISSKKPDGVFEEEHESGIDDPVSQLIGIDLKGKPEAFVSV